MGLFRFKRFSVDDSGCAMKIGTDGVLLGAWTPLPVSGNALDIGCGSGLVSMLIAQRNPLLTITAVEIEPDAAAMAGNNIACSPFADRIEVICSDIRNYQKHKQHKFDLIVSNPPYFQTALKGKENNRNRARHDLTLNFDELSETVSLLLQETGVFALILPHASFDNFRNIAAGYGIFPSGITYVLHRPEAPYNRVLATFGKRSIVRPTVTSLIIMDNDKEYSQQYLELVRDFYLFA